MWMHSNKIKVQNRYDLNAKGGNKKLEDIVLLYEVHSFGFLLKGSLWKLYSTSKVTNFFLCQIYNHCATNGDPKAP